MKLITPSGAEVKNEWSHAFTQWPNGVDGNICTSFLTLRNTQIVSVLPYVLFVHASPPCSAFLDHLIILCLIVLTDEEKSEAKYSCSSASHEGIWGIGGITPRILNLEVRWM